MTAQLLLASLAYVYLIAIVRMWVLDRDGVQLRLPSEEVHRVRVGATFELRFALANRSGFGFARAHLRPSLSSGLRGEPSVRLGYLHAGSAAEIAYPVRGVRAGRWTIHGAHAVFEDLPGLVTVAAFLPLSHHISVWPQPQAPTAPIDAARPERAPIGASLARRAGQGLELRELRDHAPGDSLRRVDWKATARRGTLTVREYEDEVAVRMVVALDMSSTMRGGDGGAVLDHAMRLGLELIELAAKSNHRVALLSFDDSVYGSTPLAAGAAHYRRLGQHVLSLANVCDERFTEATEHDAIEAVVRYLRAHERLDFRRPVARTGRPVDSFAPTHELFYIDALEQWVEQEISGTASHRIAEMESAGVPVASMSAVRRFAWLRGVELPYRSESRMTRRLEGLVSTLESAQQALRRGGTVFVISDLAGVTHLPAVEQALRRAAAVGTRVVFLVPHAPSFVSEPKDALAKRVHGLLANQLASTERERTDALARCGAVVVRTQPSTPATAALVALRGGRR